MWNAADRICVQSYLGKLLVGQLSVDEVVASVYLNFEQKPVQHIINKTFLGNFHVISMLCSLIWPLKR